MGSGATIPALSAYVGDTLTLSGKSGAGNTGYIVSCQGEPYVSTAEFTVVDKGTWTQVAKCINGFSDTGSNIFSAFFCRGTDTLGAFKDPNSNVLNNTHNWAATGLPIQHGRITAVTTATLMGACTKWGSAQWCNGCPGTSPGGTFTCDKTCSGSDVQYENLSPACNVPANGISASAVQQTLNATGQFTPSAQGNYRLLDTAYTARGSGDTDTKPCAVDVQVGPPANPPPPNCQDLGGNLTSNPTASTFGGVLNVFVLGNDTATYVISSDTNGTFTPGDYTSLGGAAEPGDPRSFVDAGNLYVFVNGGAGANGNIWSKYTGDAYANWYNQNNPSALTNSTAYLNGTKYDFLRGRSGQLLVCPAPSGTLTASPCAIGSSAATCQSTLNWTTKNVLNPANLKIKNRNTTQEYSPGALSGSTTMPVGEGTTATTNATA